MTEKEIKKLAKKAKKSLFCNVSKRPIVCSSCELAHSSEECGDIFEIGFLYGYWMATGDFKMYK